MQYSQQRFFLVCAHSLDWERDGAHISLELSTDIDILPMDSYMKDPILRYCLVFLILQQICFIIYFPLPLIYISRGAPTFICIKKESKQELAPLSLSPQRQL